LRDALADILHESHPMTVRQVFYQAVGRNLVEKTEKACKGTIGRLLGLMREEGQIPFSYIADNTRWMRKPSSHSGLESMLELTAKTYRRATWNDQDCYVEIWCEKDALAGVLYQETSKWDVPLMVVRGFSSKTFLYEAAKAIEEVGKPAHLYYFGDRDPSGVYIDRNIEAKLRQYAPEADIHFRRVAVTEDQIETLNLPTRPTKKSDLRCKSFKGDSVEVDAIPADVLREMVELVIAQHIDADAWSRSLAVEQAERDTLRAIASQDWSHTRAPDKE
jgi:hypothetical protein